MSSEISITIICTIHQIEGDLVDSSVVLAPVVEEAGNRKEEKKEEKEENEDLLKADT